MIDRNGHMITANPSATAHPRDASGARSSPGTGTPEWSFIDADGAAAADADRPLCIHRDDRALPGVRGGRAAATPGEHPLARRLHARRGDRPRPAVHDRRLVHRRHRGARGRRGARALQHRALPVRLHRLARPVRAAADGVELSRAAAPPLPGPAGPGRGRVHRVRRRRRRAHADADRGPARVLTGGQRRGARRARGARRRPRTSCARSRPRWSRRARTSTSATCRW